MSLFQITPDILSATPSWFANGYGFPPGAYPIAWVSGAVNIAAGVAGKWGAWAGNYIITDGNGNDMALPVPGCSSATEAATEAAAAGQMTTYHHVGGKIGMHFSDSSYSDNIPGAAGAPTFQMTASAGVIVPVPSLFAQGQLVANTPSILVSGP